jgi:hypothetical protein
MGISDKIAGATSKVTDAVKGRSDEMNKAVDAAGDKVDDATGGKFKDKVDKGQNAAKDAINKLGKK